DLVLALELVAQRGDGPLEVAVVCAVLPLEGRRAILEELLLPEVEERGRELVLIAEVGDGDVVDQMAPEDGDLLDGRIVLPGLPHGRNSFRVYYNSDMALLHFRLKQDTGPRTCNPRRTELSPRSLPVGAMGFGSSPPWQISFRPRRARGRFDCSHRAATA